MTDAQRLAKEKPVDIAFVCMKSYDTAWATMLIRQYLAPDGYVVSLQNCMNEETIAGILGGDLKSGPNCDAHYATGTTRLANNKGQLDTARVGNLVGWLLGQRDERKGKVGMVQVSVSLATRPEKREYSRQFGSHPGNPGLTMNNASTATTRFIVGCGEEADRPCHATGRRLRSANRDRALPWFKGRTQCVLFNSQLLATLSTVLSASTFPSPTLPAQTRSSSASSIPPSTQTTSWSHRASTHSVPRFQPSSAMKGSAGFWP